MDFELLLQQRQAKESAAKSTESVEAAGASSAPANEPKATRNRKQVDGSKRSTWKMRAWYVQPETASRLRAYVNRQQEAGVTLDASEVVDQAIAAWLKRHGA